MIAYGQTMTIRQVDLRLKIENFTTLRYSLVCANYNYIFVFCLSIKPRRCIIRVLESQSFTCQIFQNTVSV